MKSSLWILIPALVFTAACGDAADDADDTSPPPEGPLCARGTLEPDLAMQTPLMGSGVDPATGAIAPPPSGSYVVSSTYLALKPDPAAQARFGELTGPIQAALMNQEGLVGLQLASSKSCVTARTLTIWASEEAMYAFVTGPAHMEAASSFSEVSRGGSVVTHWSAASTGEIRWEEAAKKLAALANTYD